MTSTSPAVDRLAPSREIGARRDDAGSSGHNAARRNKTVKATARRTTFVIVAIAASFLFLLPIIWIFTTAFKPTSEIFAIPPTLLPSSPTTANFQSVFTDGVILKMFGNSLFVGLGATVVSLVLGVPAAFGFAKFRYRMSGILLGGALVTRMFPPVALALPFFLEFRQLGLINNTAGLIIAYIPIVLPLIIWMLEGFFRDFPDEILEAARLDGLGTLASLWKIVLPLARPAIGVAALFGFLAAWNEFVIALSLTKTPDAQTMPVGIASYITQFQTIWGQMTAASVIYLLPVLVVTLIAQRGIISGLMSGATKG
ncbi:carbohydrate ABC transporter permease [Diaminobutyricibacter tongyongensis]|uniref:Carbohydrate ABC transporter permease n=1 Tax=Leifsonia tongyongensis TaxID=1268043 RepID=A0A6L9XUR0_9MICO|nr:carbohydrate ABC transporter permease [Diaminobutyricibacter tongyongensis]NEN04758.1 carbohydrate ABC transporter permease [Diaminobutyricibacter tongyongensis]